MDGDSGGMGLHGGQSTAFWLAYGPLLLWGPLLGIVTVHYWRRRTALTPAMGREVS